MNLRGFRPSLILAGAMILMSLLLQGCGQNKQAVSGGGSFAVTAIEASGTENSLFSNAADDIPVTSAQPSLVPSASSAPAEKTDNSGVSPDSPSTVASIQTAPTTEATTAITSKATPEATATVNATATMTATPIQPSASQSAKPTSKPTSKPSAAANTVSTAKPDLLGVTGIGWSEFFDGEDQTRPSERFWDLHGSQVTIKGFMGEVLSFEKNWFLLIPEPGAECPFDNGDETYWNKIMIVFVPDDFKLRYKSAPLQITGRLDVGIKIDDSGYKTMFRLYDASFEEIQ